MYIKVKTSDRPYVVKANKQKDFPIDSLWIPEKEYQRSSVQWHVNRLAANWRDEVYTRPLIAVRPNGLNVVVNGAHTLRALAEKGAVTAPCDYFMSKANDKDAEIYEAGVFSNKNTTLSMTACVKFKAEVSKREPNAVRINKAIRACGLYVDGMKANGIRIKSIKACVDVYIRGGLGQSGSNHLKVVLSTLKKKWQGQQKCFHGSTIDGLSLFLNTYSSLLDMKVLCRSMSNYSPIRLWLNSDGTSGPATRAVTAAKTFREFYNLSCDKKKKLPIVSFGRKKKSAKKSNKKKASS